MVDAGIASWNTAGFSSASGRYCTRYGIRLSQRVSRPGPSTSWRAHGDKAPASASMRPLATSITATAAMRTIAPSSSRWPMARPRSSARWMPSAWHSAWRPV